MRKTLNYLGVLVLFIMSVYAHYSNFELIQNFGIQWLIFSLPFFLFPLIYLITTKKNIGRFKIIKLLVVTFLALGGFIISCDNNKFLYYSYLSILSILFIINTVYGIRSILDKKLNS